MALFFFLETNYIKPESSKLCTKACNYEKSERDWMDCSFQNRQEEKN